MPEKHKFSGTNQKPERRRPFGTGLVKHCPQGLFSPFFTFLRATFSRPFRLSLVPTISPWVSEDVPNTTFTPTFLERKCTSKIHHKLLLRHNTSNLSFSLGRIDRSRYANQIRERRWKLPPSRELTRVIAFRRSHKRTRDQLVSLSRGCQNFTRGRIFFSLQEMKDYIYSN